MKKEEKDIYALIFKLALAISKNHEYAFFAKCLIDSAQKEATNEDFEFLWATLKDYADIGNDEKKWDELVRVRCEDYLKDKNAFTLARSGVADVLHEIERRSRKGVEK